MFKKILIICLIAGFAYYAGAKGLTIGDITDWFEESNITGIIKQTLNKTIELAEEKQVAIKAEKIIHELKVNITN
ncbi:MAG: hypothetical protein ACJ0DG_12480 [bacterium]